MWVSEPQPQQHRPEKSGFGVTDNPLGTSTLPRLYARAFLSCLSAWAWCPEDTGQVWSEQTACSTPNLPTNVDLPQALVGVGVGEDGTLFWAWGLVGTFVISGLRLGGRTPCVPEGMQVFFR